MRERKYSSFPLIPHESKLFFISQFRKVLRTKCSAVTNLPEDYYRLSEIATALEFSLVHIRNSGSVYLGIHD